MLKEFPSLIKSKMHRPHGWIQWKGTDICADMYCVCGEQFHFDGYFMYHIKCPYCQQVYECSGFFKLLPLDFEPKMTKHPEREL